MGWIAGSMAVSDLVVHQLFPNAKESAYLNWGIPMACGAAIFSAGIFALKKVAREN